VFGYIFGYRNSSSSTPSSGATYQYDAGTGTDHYYHYYIPASLKTVIITGDSNIGRNAFQNCSSLTSVTIPEGVTSIGQYAFYNCSGLTGITIPKSLTGISDYAFYGCSGLRSVTIPGSVRVIGEYAFYGCAGLTSVIFALGSAIISTEFGDNAFPEGNSGGGNNLRAAYLAGSATIYTRAAGGTAWTGMNMAKPVWRDGNAITLTAPYIGGFENVSAQGWQISDTISGGWMNFTPPSTANMSYKGKYLRYYITSGGQTYYSNTESILVLSATQQEVTIAMWSRHGFGWGDANAMLRINVNGTDNPTIVRLTSGGGPGYYTFMVNASDVVRIYWLNGDYNDSACAFAAYYSNDPPNPMYNPSAGMTDYRVLVSKSYTAGLGTVGDGSLMGSFTVTITK
jgi:hypothetical protein